MSAISLLENKHPDPEAQGRFDALVGIDEQKGRLLEHLHLLLDPAILQAWHRRHHHQGLPVLERLARRAPLVLLSGDVGCGKTALGTTVASPLAQRLNRQILCLETPSDVRGSGRVGEISARISEVFTQARARIGSAGLGLLLIDEADDLATSRGQMQAHHEDRAGLNVLVRQIDLLERERVRLAVLLITNRPAVLDAAVHRRASLHLRFARPDAGARRALFEHLLKGTRTSAAQLDGLVEASERKPLPYSYSDLVQRLAQAALQDALRDNRPFNAETLRRALDHLEPSPAVD